MLEQCRVSCEISIPQVLEASAEALCKATGVEELVKFFDRYMVVVEMGFAPWKATLRGAFHNVDKALKENFLNIMLEIWKRASTLTVLDEAVKRQIQVRFDLNLSTKAWAADEPWTMNMAAHEKATRKDKDQKKKEAAEIATAAARAARAEEERKAQEAAEAAARLRAEEERKAREAAEAAARAEEERKAREAAEAAARAKEERKAREAAEAAARLRAEEERKAREEERKAREAAEAAARAEEERKAREAAEAAARAKEERKAREAAEAAARLRAEEERKAREAAEAAARAEEERKAREAAEAAARTKEERKAREAAEAAARLRAEEERKAREAAEAAARAEEERKAREAAEAAARTKEERKAREAAEAAARLRAEEERKAREAAEAAARAEEERKAREAAEAAARAEEERKAREAAEVAAMAEEERQARETAEAAARAEEERKAREAAEAARMEEEERKSREAAEAAARAEEQRKAQEAAESVEVTVKVEEQRKAEHAAKKLPPKHKAAPPIFHQRPVPKRMPLHRVPKHDYTGLGDVPQWLQDKENRAYEAYARNPPPGHKPLEEAWRWRSRRTFELQSIQKEGDPETEPDLQDRLLALPARELLLDLRALADKEEAMSASVPEALYLQLSMAYEAYKWAFGLGRLSIAMKETLRDQIWDTVLYVEDRFRDRFWTRQAAQTLKVLVTVPAMDLLETRPQAQTVRSLEAPAAAKPAPRKRPRSPTSPPAPRKRSYRISVPVDEVEFSQDSIGERFTCGRELQTTIDDLRHGKVHPDSSAFLVLNAMKTAARTRFICRNNRRLHCLKEFQKRERRRRGDRDFTVKVRLNVIEDRDRNISDFIGHRTRATKDNAEGSEWWETGVNFHSGPAVEDNDSGDSPSPAASWP
ncbi:ttn-1 [Symbiodinium sp. CCMP2592]|nr:ttn-1 [Symbiodinium sp. CCMP2592]